MISLGTTITEVARQWYHDQRTRGPVMDYLVVMTTHVPEGTSEATVEDVRAREAAHSWEQAEQGQLERLRVPPSRGRALGLWRARDGAGMEGAVQSLPLDSWMTTQITPLTPHPSNPVVRGS
jgi:muconolactone delta-isomerase